MARCVITLKIGIRLEFIGSFIIFGSAMFAVMSILIYGYVDPSTVGLCMTYSLSVTHVSGG
jgi:ATP-binding cassette subfamily C (CFTR/MRP) protein 1